MNALALKNLSMALMAVLLAGGWLADLPDNELVEDPIAIEQLLDESLLASLPTTTLPNNNDLLALLDGLLPELNFENADQGAGSPFSALYNNAFTLEEAGDGEPYDLEFMGDGTNSLLGATSLRFGGSISLDEMPYTTSGIVALTDVDGDRLYGRAIGESMASESNESLVRLRLRVVFGGGTGKFGSATGDATVEGAVYFLSEMTGTATWSLQGDLALPDPVEAVFDNELEINTTDDFLVIRGDGFSETLGELQYAFEGTVDLDVLPASVNGQVILTDADGDQLATAEEAAHGWLTPQSDGSVLELRQTLPFTNGTGKFANTAGSIAVEGAAVLLEEDEGRLFGSVSLKLQGGLSRR